MGGEDGIIRVYRMSPDIDIKSPEVVLETKSGPVQTLAIHDVTKFYHNDLIVGDSCGTVTVFCNQQILCRHNLARDNISCLQIQNDAFGSCSIVCSDESGNVCAIQPTTELWKININNLPIFKNPAQKTVIRCLLSAELAGVGGEKCNYIIAADDRQHLHVINQGEVVMTVNTPTVVTAMCCGNFIDTVKLEGVQEASGSKDNQQVALGSASGAIYILHNFTVTEDEFANANYPITNLHRYPNHTGQLDFLLSTGHFNALHVYHDGKKVGHLETSDWVNSIAIAESSKDNQPSVVLGCLDNSILSVKITENVS